MDPRDSWGDPVDIEALPELCGSADEIPSGEPPPENPLT